MREIYYYKFGYKTTKMEKQWIYYYIFVGILQNYKKLSFFEKKRVNIKLLLWPYYVKNQKNGVYTDVNLA